MTLETMAALSDNPIVGLPAMVILPTRPMPEKRRRPAVGYTTIGDTI
jgi:hypothetical protein